MAQPLTIVVTGSNRGIGRGIVQLLADTKHPRPLHIYATSRSGTDLSINPSHSNQISYSKLDISSSTSISHFIQTTINEDKSIDVLINNAGLNNDHINTPESMEEVINVNYYGTKNACLAFLDQGKMSTTNGARIVNVSSTGCSLKNYSPALQSRFRSVKTISDVDALVTSYLSALRSDTQEKEGWGPGPRSYQVSKASMNALTVVLARENPGVSVNCCCPGWVTSDMGKQSGQPVKTLEEGARIPVRLAIGELGARGDRDGGLGKGGEENVSGRYFGNDDVADRGWGRAREW
ncbi:hypothetical protein NX059_009269 [Plenodomus lindquistii]|nr:hypothetical protein NX059_009269 [Plenodomus lindquistii]